MTDFRVRTDRKPSNNVTFAIGGGYQVDTSLVTREPVVEQPKKELVLVAQTIEEEKVIPVVTELPAPKKGRFAKKEENDATTDAGKE